LLVVIGGVISAMGLAAIHMGYWWILTYETRAGTPGYAPTLALVLVGAFVLTVGLIPWPKSKEPKRYS